MSYESVSEICLQQNKTKRKLQNGSQLTHLEHSIRIHNSPKLIAVEKPKHIRHRFHFDWMNHFDWVNHHMASDRSIGNTQTEID